VYNIYPADKKSQSFLQISITSKTARPRQKMYPRIFEIGRTTNPVQLSAGTVLICCTPFPERSKSELRLVLLAPHKTHTTNNVLQVENFNYLKEFAEVVPPPRFGTCVSKGKPKIYKDAPDQVAGEHQFINSWNPIGHPVSELILNLLQ
jgi:hypothetical protein